MFGLDPHWRIKETWAALVRQLELADQVFEPPLQSAPRTQSQCWSNILFQSPTNTKR